MIVKDVYVDIIDVLNGDNMIMSIAIGIGLLFGAIFGAIATAFYYTRAKDKPTEKDISRSYLQYEIERMLTEADLNMVTRLGILETVKIELLKKKGLI